MPSSPISNVQDFSRLTQVTDSLYVQCFVAQHVHADYIPLLQNQVAAICKSSGMPALHSEIVAYPTVFSIQQIRYTVYPQGVLAQLGLGVVSGSSSSRSTNESAASLLPDQVVGDPTAAPDAQ
ncbi:hypothetical protein [Hymenobacter sp. AT01-02]|uniref:hypothetical protein n=1 Tax=Hymenobacter sp. AT01-02 TaxID=1571877 RepID=UPI0005F23E78|nr:hypothetical protein [Hymenobacter sp. AT01-02]